jgi:hypothetical protein
MRKGKEPDPDPIHPTNGSGSEIQEAQIHMDLVDPDSDPDPPHCLVKSFMSLKQKLNDK